MVLFRALKEDRQWFLEEMGKGSFLHEPILQALNVGKVEAIDRFLSLDMGQIAESLDWEVGDE
jgi:hypothetical protein